MKKNWKKIELISVHKCLVILIIKYLFNIKKLMTIFTTYLNKLGKPIVFSSYIYVCGIITYNSVYTYHDAQKIN